MIGYVYILRSLKDKKKYIGSTINIIKRLKIHNKGGVNSTKNRRPLILETYQECATMRPTVAALRALTNGA